MCGASGKLVVDHDHATGLVRGLLCRTCNVIEGKVHSLLNDVEPSEAMTAYLACPPAAALGWLWEWRPWWLPFAHAAYNWPWLYGHADHLADDELGL